MKKSYNRWIALGVMALIVTGVVLWRFVWQPTVADGDAPQRGRGAQGPLSVQGMVIGQQPLS